MVSLAEIEERKSVMDEGRIQAHPSPESFRKGEDYYHQGAVLSVAHRGDTLHAEVAGSARSLQRPRRLR